MNCLLVLGACHASGQSGPNTSKLSGINFPTGIAEQLLAMTTDERLALAVQLGVSVYRRSGAVDTEDTFAKLPEISTEDFLKFPNPFKRSGGQYTRYPRPMIMLAPDTDPLVLVHELLHHFFTRADDFDSRYELYRIETTERLFRTHQGRDALFYALDLVNLMIPMIPGTGIEEAAIEAEMYRAYADGKFQASEFYSQNAAPYADLGLKNTEAALSAAKDIAKEARELFEKCRNELSPLNLQLVEGDLVKIDLRIKQFEGEVAEARSHLKKVFGN